MLPGGAEDAIGALFDTEDAGDLEDIKGRAAAVVCKTGAGGLALDGMPPSIADTGMGLASNGGPLRA